MGSRLMAVAATVQHAMQRHGTLLKGVITPSQRRAAASSIQAPQDYFDAAPTFKQSYAPQSGEIFGILTQMLETFEANLAQSQEEEMKNQKAYEDLKKAKEAEIAAGQEQIDKKTAELADTDEKNAQAKEDIEDTKKSLSADEEFLMMLKGKCSMTDKEWEERQKTRSWKWRQCPRLWLSPVEMMHMTCSQEHSTLLSCRKAAKTRCDVNRHRSFCLRWQRN